MTDRGLESLKTNMPQLQTFEVANLGKGGNTSPADFLNCHQSWRFMVESVDSKRKCLRIADLIYLLQNQYPGDLHEITSNYFESEAPVVRES